MNDLKPLTVVLLGTLPFFAAAQSIEERTESFPPHVSALTTWGVRLEWDESSEHVCFLHRLVGDVLKVNLKTRVISLVTGNVHHGEIQRCLCLANGDLLLGTGDIEPINHSDMPDFFLNRLDQPLELLDGIAQPNPINAPAL